MTLQNSYLINSILKNCASQSRSKNFQNFSRLKNTIFSITVDYDVIITSQTPQDTHPGLMINRTKFDARTYGVVSKELNHTDTHRDTELGFIVQIRGSQTGVRDDCSRGPWLQPGQ